MSLLKSFEFIPGVKWFETEMHNSLFQHSVFGAIVFLIVSHTDVYKFVGKIIEVKDKNVLMLVHAVVFAVIMYFGSMYLFSPLLAEGYPEKAKADKFKKEKAKKRGGKTTSDRYTVKGIEAAKRAATRVKSIEAAERAAAKKKNKMKTKKK
tara:strand:- start:109 stop:561 length:453 start_codon:yes stop_codon:yes gene_type:complete